LNIVITGANGFIGKNLALKLSESKDSHIIPILRNDKEEVLRSAIELADVVIHLAGENRPQEADGFHRGNVIFTEKLASLVKNSNKKISILYASSTQASENNPYGRSKLSAEKILERLSEDFQIPLHIYRLPGIFGKWARPNYNSVVATFCHNIANDLPIIIADPDKLLKLHYIDDLLLDMTKAIKINTSFIHRRELENEYIISVGDLAKKIKGFKEGRLNLQVAKVGQGFDRALYATYISYLPKDKFSYSLQPKIDHRGSFVEILKTTDSGQFSFFTIHPNSYRGGHYHHTKTEKFLVIKGNARFRFKNIMTGEMHQIITSDQKYEVVETIPGWTHDVTNIGDSELLAILWSNEVFDRLNPDTIQREI